MGLEQYTPTFKQVDQGVLIILSKLCQINVTNYFFLRYHTCTDSEITGEDGSGAVQPTFKQERINGDLLSACDDDILREELKVSSRLHRIRLLRVI